MKKNILFLTFSLSSIMFFAQTKIAVVNIQEVIISMPEARAADSTLQLFQQELQIAYGEILQELKEKDSIFQADSSNWTSTIKELKRQDLERLYGQLQSWQQTSEQSIQRRQQELLNPLKNSALAAIEKVAQAKGYTQVLEESVVYFNSSAESSITELVKAELRK